MTLRRNRTRSRVAAKLGVVGALVVGAVGIGSTAASAAPIDVDQKCAASNVQEIGNDLISGPISTQIASSTFTLPLPTEVTATAEVIPNGTIQYQADVELDVQTLTQDLLENQVKPGIAAQAPGTGLENSAYLEIGLTNLHVDFPAPADTTLTGSPSASTLPGGSPAATGSIVGTAARASLAGPIQAGAYQTPAPPVTLPTLNPFTVRLQFAAKADATEGDTIVLHPGPATFGLSFNVGIATLALSGGATADMSCTPDDGTLELASTTILAPIAPDAPTAVTGSPGNESVVVSWTAPQSDGGSPITQYDVTSDPDGATCSSATTSCKVEGLTNGTAYTFTVTATNDVGTSPASDPSGEITPEAPTQNQYFELPPHRILNTFDSEPIGAADTLDLEVTGGSTTVPVDAQAVALNVTGVHPTEETHLTIWPAGQTMPTASNINLPPGSTRPNMVIVKVGAGDKISIYNNSGDTNVIVDVNGYFADADGGVYTALEPVRKLDTYNGLGTTATPFGPGEARALELTAPVPEDATAVVLNLTGVFPSAGTHLTVFPTGTLMPDASNVNVEPGQTNANMVIAKIGNDHSISIFNNAGSMNVLVDVMGYFTPSTEPAGDTLAAVGAPAAGVGGEYTAITPNRILDSGTGLGFDEPWDPGQTRDLEVTGGVTNVPDDATAVVLNVTAVHPTVGTHLTVWPTGTDVPNVSNLNLPAGDTRANLVVVKIGVFDQVSIYNNTGNVDVIADVVGYFTGDVEPECVSVCG